jgi:hypothetical protein
MVVRLGLALFGGLLAVGGIAALIVASRHRPRTVPDPLLTIGHTVGWSGTAYDAARIGGWGLVTFGAIVVVFSLMREVRGREP